MLTGKEYRKKKREESNKNPHINNSKRYLIVALLYLISGICFIFGAIFQVKTSIKILNGFSAINVLISSLIYFIMCIDERKISITNNQS